MALSIAEPYLKKDVEIVYQVFPMVKNFFDSSDAWVQNKEEILSLLQQGKQVAFLTLGDPMFYSTYIYVYRLLEQEGVRIETIPGVPAFAAIGSRLGYPIVEGNDILSIIPATASKEKIEAALKISDNAVLMKVYHNFSEIVELLEQNQMAEHAVLVSRCGLEDERRMDDIGAHKGEEVNYLSTILARRHLD